MVKHAVQDHLHPPTVRFPDQPDQKLVARLQILFIRYPLNIFGRLRIIPASFRKHRTAVFYNFSIINYLSEMRVDIIIILDIIFMIRGRYENRIKINHIHAQLLQIVHFVQNAL